MPAAGRAVVVFPASGIGSTPEIQHCSDSGRPAVSQGAAPVFYSPAVACPGVVDGIMAWLRE